MASFIQPFLSYTTKDAATIALNTESTYDWESEKRAIPVNVTATKVVTLGSQLVSLGGGVRYWADSTNGGPKGWGARLIFTLLFPK